MERFETDALTDINGDVVVHVGVAGVRVHVVAVFAGDPMAARQDDEWLGAVGAWKDYEFHELPEGALPAVEAIWPESP